MPRTGELKGRSIREVRPMTPDEMSIWGWDGQTPPLAFVLDDNTLVFPSRDIEGNEPGALLLLGPLPSTQTFDLRLAQGMTITDEGGMFDEEMRRMGWSEDSIDGRPSTLVLGNGTYFVYPASGLSGSYPGSLFGRLPTGENMTWQQPPTPSE